MTPDPMTPAEIIRRTSEESGAQYWDVIGPRRSRYLVNVRALCALRLRARGYSYPEVGSYLGGRHHTTAMYLCGVIPTKRQRERMRQSI